MWKNSLIIILAFFSIIFLITGSFLFFIICISLSALFLLKSFKFSLVKHNTEKQNTNIKNKTTKTTWIIGGIMIISIILLFIFGIDSQNNYSSQTPKKINTNDIGDKIDLHIQAQQFVLQGLKAPATAKFPALPYEAIDLGNDRYKIMSFVDSQNSFGALIRSDWTVVMKTSNNSWVLERMIIGGEVVYDPIQEEKDYEEIKKINTENNAHIDQVIQQIDQQQQLLKSLQQ